MAAATRKELLKKVYTMVPPMLESFHKGTKEHTHEHSHTDFAKVNWVV
jgi:hypothetical protein